MIQSNSRITPLNSYPSLLDFLLDLRIGTKSIFKKRLSRKVLLRPVEGKVEISLPLDVLNIGQIGPRYLGPEIKVISEQGPFLALDKPAKVPCHCLRYSEQDSLLNFVREMGTSENGWNDFLSVNREKAERGLVNRLDTETSGVIVLCSDQIIQNQLRADFKSFVLKKIYCAVVDGEWIHGLGLIKHYLKPYGAKGHKQAEANEGEGALATLEILDFEYLEELDKTLLWINLETGLRHQIRAQMSFVGFPIVGDLLYGGSVNGRLYLHAFQYELKGIEGKKMSFLSRPECGLFQSFSNLDRCF